MMYLFAGVYFVHVCVNLYLFRKCFQRGYRMCLSYGQKNIKLNDIGLAINISMFGFFPLGSIIPVVQTLCFIDMIQSLGIHIKLFNPYTWLVFKLCGAKYVEQVNKLESL